MHFSHLNASDKLAIRVNGALGLENFESVSVGFRQILMSRLICKRAIVVRNLGVPKRRPGALRHSGKVPVLFFLNPCAYRNFEGRGEGSRQHGAAVLHADRDRPHQPRIYGRDLYYKLRVLHST